MRHWLGRAATLAAVLAGTPAWAGSGWTFSSGVDYTQGDYGETRDTTIVTVPLEASYGTDRWCVSLTVPFVSVDGPGTIVPSGLAGGGPIGNLLGGGAVSNAVASGSVDEMGLGDVSMAASIVAVKADAGPQVTLSGRIKAPTADADRKLGTGEGAAAVSGGLRQMVGERAALFGTVGYEQSFEGASGVFAQAGVEGYVADRVLLGSTLDFAQASSELRRDSMQAGAYVGFDVSSGTRVLAYGSAGLSETSPDVGAGLRIVFTPD